MLKKLTVLFAFAIFVLSALATSASGQVTRGKNSKGQHEVAPALATVHDDTVNELVSDGDSVYIHFGLDGGDCVHLILPARDGVNKGLALFFLPGPPSECQLDRRLFALGDLPDLDQDTFTFNNEPDGETIFGRFSCANVYIKNSPIGLTPNTTTTSCKLTVHEIFYINDIPVATSVSQADAVWIIEWSNVLVTHINDDFRRVVATEQAEVFEMVQVRKNRKDKVSQGDFSLDFNILFERTDFSQ